MLWKKLDNGDEIHRTVDRIAVYFAEKRNVLSTCAANGGRRDDLHVVFNCDSSKEKTISCEMKAATMEEHMQVVAKELGFDPQDSAGMCTAAQMENGVWEEESFDGVSVTAIITGGIDENGGRVGDPASWQEKEGSIINLTQGTINIILEIDAKLTEGALAEALMTVVEGKCAAVQELLLPSKYSQGLATGSGTDKVIIIANPQSPHYLSNAGKHSKLGEMIGRTVIRAAKRALYLQTQVGAIQACSVLERMGRLGLEKEQIYQECRAIGITEAEFNRFYPKVDHDRELAVLASLYAHLLDQLAWGLIAQEEAITAARQLLSMMQLSWHLEVLSWKEEGFIIELAECLARLVKEQRRKGS